MKYLVKSFFLVFAFMNHASELLIIGHRGASGYEAENTLSSFKKALELGVAMIEFDVHKCATGQLVVIHDHTIDRTTNGTGLVRNFTFDQLKSVKTRNNENISTLQEVLDFINKRVSVNIEIKDNEIEGDLIKIIEYYVENKGWRYSDFLVSSFNHHQLKKIKEQNSNINVGALIGGISIDYAANARKIDAYSIHAWKEFITKEYVDDAHKRGMKFFVFTVNDLNEARYFSSLGVDGIITDYPDLLLQLS